MSDLIWYIGNSHIAKVQKNRKRGKKMKKAYEIINSVRENNIGIKDNENYVICLYIRCAFCVIKLRILLEKEKRNLRFIFFL